MVAYTLRTQTFTNPYSNFKGGINKKRYLLNLSYLNILLLGTNLQLHG